MFLNDAYEHFATVEPFQPNENNENELNGNVLNGNVLNGNVNICPAGCVVPRCDNVPNPTVEPEPEPEPVMEPEPEPVMEPEPEPEPEERRRRTERRSSVATPKTLEPFQAMNPLQNKDLNLVLKAALYGCIFYLLSHPDTVKFVSKNVHNLNASASHLVLSVIFIFVFIGLSKFL